ncbi:Uncharacterized protein GY17_00003979, partial [Cryptosporidium hominis]
MGLFILNEDLNSLIELQTDLDFEFKKIIQESNPQVPIKYILEEGFFYPNNILFIGYETCSLRNECRLDSTSCNSQVLKDTCDKRIDEMSWTFETSFSETNVNNGTWSQDLVIPDLLGVYLINNGHVDISIIYLFKNRLVLKGLILDQVCSGPYPRNQIKQIGDKITWSLAIDSNDLLYLNIIDDSDPKNKEYYTICPISYDNRFGRFKYIYPLGHAPSKVTFTQDLKGFPQGGYDSTSDPTNSNGGFYYPDKDKNTGEIKPEDKYGESYPFFPPGIKPAPIDGDESNTPPGYHYNTTTGQFEKDEDNTNLDEINPFQPNHIVDGISECDLYLFSTCNATSAKIMPEDVTFKEGWTLFVILSTGVPDYDETKYNGFNYKYEFKKSDNSNGGLEETVLSLEYSNDTVTFKNLKTNEQEVVGSPQCGPYCSTYPKGYFAFWLTYEPIRKMYSIGIENNSKYLMEIKAEDNVVFNKIVPCCGDMVDKSYNIWQLTDSVKSTTTTKTPWEDVELDDCPLDMSSPCKGINSTLTIPDKFEEGNFIWINSSIADHGKTINVNNIEMTKIYHFKDNNQDEILILGFNMTHLTLIDNQSSKEYSSYYTNQTTSFPTKSFSIGIGWSRLGLFVLNEYGDGLIQLKSDKKYEFVKIEQAQVLETLTIYEWSNKFVYPREMLFLGYSICSAYNDCTDDNSLSCSAQAFGDLCNRRKTNISWDIEFKVTETYVNNGTWGNEFELPGLVNIYFVSNDHQNILSIYFFQSYLALRDLENQNICSGPYPESMNISQDDKINWSLNIGHSGEIYLNIESWKGSNKGTKFTICMIGGGSNGKNKYIQDVKYIHPLGYSPSFNKYTQINSLLIPNGGYESTSDPTNNNGGFYYPDKDENTGEIKPEDKYGESYPFFPP